MLIFLPLLAFKQSWHTFLWEFDISICWLYSEIFHGNLHSLVEWTACCSCKVLLANVSSWVDQTCQHDLNCFYFHYYSIPMCMRVKIYSVFEYYLYLISPGGLLHIPDLTCMSFRGLYSWNHIAVMLKLYMSNGSVSYTEAFSVLFCFYLQWPILGRLHVILKQYYLLCHVKIIVHSCLDDIMLFFFFLYCLELC